MQVQNSRYGLSTEKLKYLEGYVFVGQWPTEEYNFHFLTYHDSLSSDLVNNNYSNQLCA